MKRRHPFPRNELAEPLRSIVDDIASSPVPENLIEHARGYTVEPTANATSRRSVSALMATVLVLSLCISALIVRQHPRNQPQKVAEKEQAYPTRPKKEIPPPTLWAYRQAHSAEDLEELLNRHAAILLPVTSEDDLHPFHPFSQKEEL